jgi:hypothetical protein
VLDGIAMHFALAAAASPFVVEGVAERAHFNGPEAEFAAVCALLQYQLVSI